MRWDTWTWGVVRDDGISLQRDDRTRLVRIFNAPPPWALGRLPLLIQPDSRTPKRPMALISPLLRLRDLRREDGLDLLPTNAIAIRLDVHRPERLFRALDFRRPGVVVVEHWIVGVVAERS